MGLGELQKVTKSFGDVVAISDVSFSIEEGIMGFLGPNGSGKTTSIRLLLGLLRPQSGQVSLFGQNPVNNRSIKDIGYVPEANSFHTFLTAKKYLVTLGRFYMPKPVAIKRADEVLAELDLQHVSNKKISMFSKGMKQRIKIGQALMHKPRLIIADEPFNGLDPIIRKNLFKLFETYRKEYGTTFFISSHILFEVERLADQVVILYKGRTIAQGHPNKIRELIQEQPHTISITSPQIYTLVKLLIDQQETKDNLLSSFKFVENTNTDDLHINVLTRNPKEFYALVTELVVENEIIIKEMKSDEGLESLFQSLTVG